jgi:uncharacterized protein (TIGR03663 family)
MEESTRGSPPQESRRESAPRAPGGASEGRGTRRITTSRAVGRITRFHVNAQVVILVLIALALIITRFWALGNRSFGHDESIHAWYSWQLVTGQGYVHDPVYHGPFGYHVVAFMFLLFGISNVSARVAPALFSVALVLLVWPLRRWLGRAGAIFAMLLLTISPTLMYRGRYFRHDIWVMVAFMVIAICIFNYLEHRKERWLYIIAGALAVAFCSKAISFITGFIFGTFLVAYMLREWFRTRQSLKDLPAFDLIILLGTLVLPQAAPIFLKVARLDPLDYSAPALVRTTILVVILFAISAVIGTWWKRKAWLISAAIYYIIFILLYTTLFTNPRGIATGMVGMLGYWLSQQGVRRGSQPWYYFYFLNVVYEFLPLLLSGLAAAYYLWRRRRSQARAASTQRTRESAAAKRRTAAPSEPAEAPPLPFVPFLIYWLGMNLLLWTWVGEKMPWQNMHLVLPMGLLGGWFVGQLWEKTDWHKLRQAGAGYAAVLLPVALLSFMAMLSSLLGPTRPFAGKSLQQLDVTLGWLLSLVLLLISAGLLYRFCRVLGRDGWVRVVLGGVLIVLVAVTLRSALMLTFINQDSATEFLMYADSTPDTGLVMRELDAMSARIEGDKELKVAYDNDSSWPFVWLLRDYTNTTFFTADTGLSGDPEVVIVGGDTEAKVKAQLSAKYFRRQYRLIWWPNQDVYTGLTPAKIWRDLRDPTRRRYWWDILWSRKYPQSTTAWPYVHNFALWVRKDVAAQLWDYGPEIAGAGVELPEDEYEKHVVQVQAVQTIGVPGSGNGQFSDPKDLAVDGQGQIYVLDTGNSRVQVFGADGQFLRTWGSQGAGPSQFQEPWGIAVDQAGDVYVADTWNHRIQKFDSQGQFVTAWGTFGDSGGVLGAPDVFYGPRDVAVDGEGNVLVSDTGNKRIAKFTPDGQFITQWGGAGSLAGQFREPCGLAIDADDNVYVADVWNQRVQKFDRDLAPVAQWSVVGWESELPVNKPYMAVDGQGNVYVTEPDYHRVVKFDGTGKVLAVWGVYGSDAGSFNTPSGIAVDDAGNVYVVDSGNNRVCEFAPIL